MTVCEAEGLCREEFHPAFNPWVRFTDLACVLAALVVGVDMEEYTEEVKSKSKNTPNHMASLKFQRCRTVLVVQSGTAYGDNEAGRAFGLLLFEGSFKVLEASVAT